MDLTAIIAEFGAKYVPGGQTAKDIKTKLFAEDDLSQLFKKKPNEGSVYRSIYATIGQVMQAFAIPFADKATANFFPWEQRLGEFKIDKILYPDELRNTYMGFFTDLKEADRSKWDIIKWYIMELLLPQFKEDEKNEATYWGWQYTGFNNPPTVNGATFLRQLTAATNAQPANASVDGIRTQFCKMDDAGRLINKIVVGAWEAVDPVVFVEQVIDTVKQIPTPLREKIDLWVMAKEKRDFWRAGVREKFNKYWQQEAELDMIPDTRIKIFGSESMTGSDSMWGTPAFNRVRPTRADKPGRFLPQLADRGVKLLNDVSYINTFDIPEYIACTEHELTIDAALITARYTE